jgi:glycosyltransferase involved in cell wall biosynthesis
MNESSKAKDRELISVVVTVKNESANMRDLLDSLVTQEGPVEILIIDAASTDDTQNIVRSYQKEYKFIRYRRRPDNRNGI